MKACLALMLLVLLIPPAFFPSPARAEGPYVHGVTEEEGSEEGVSLTVESARQAYIYAPGYEKYKILGLRVRIEGQVENRTGAAYGALLLAITARDIFGRALDTCEMGMRLPPEGKKPFRCALDVAIAADLISITYKITDLTAK